MTSKGVDWVDSSSTGLRSWGSEWEASRKAKNVRISGRG